MVALLLCVAFLVIIDVSVASSIPFGKIPYKYFDSIRNKLSSDSLKNEFNQENDDDFFSKHDEEVANDDFYEYEFDRFFINIPPNDTAISISLVTPISNDVTETFPVLFEYMPYRKDDSLCYSKDYELYDYFGKRGFIMVRADIRGTGSSEGRLPNREYSDIEMTDGQYIIEWFATKYLKSNGNVAMLGISWSAINSLIISLIYTSTYLKTIFIFDAADDLYYNDIHYIDGSLHIDQDYMIYTVHETAIPSTINPVINEKYFEDRFNLQPWLITYVGHQMDSSWWRNKSVEFTINDNNVALYLWSGQLDGYRDYSIHLWNKNIFKNIKLTIGPWEHAFSATSFVHPKVEWKEEAVRWFNLWLRDGNDSILNEPKISMYVRHYTPGHSGINPVITVNGEWRTYNELPEIDEMKLYLTNNYKMSENVDINDNTIHTLKYNPIYGLYHQDWWGDNVDLGFIVNEINGVDGLIYDTDILLNMYEIIGFVNISLQISSSINISRVDWIIRLEDFNPTTNESVLVTGSNRNSANIINKYDVNDDRLNPIDMIQNEWYNISFPLHWITWQFPKNHKIRIVITNAAYPMLWSLNPSTNDLYTNIKVNNLNSFIILPISNMLYNETNNQWIVFNSSKNSLGQPSFINNEIEIFVPNNSCIYALEIPPDYTDYKAIVHYDNYTDTKMIEILSHTAMITYINDVNLINDGRISYNKYEWTMYLNETNPNHNTFEAYARTVILFNKYLNESQIHILENNGYAICLAVPPIFNIPHIPSIQLSTYILMKSDINNFYIIINRTIHQNGIIRKQIAFNETISRSFE